MKQHFPLMKGVAIALLFFVCASSANAQPESISRSKASRWTKQRTWAHGFTPMPHKTTDYREFYEQYHKNTALWDKAFTWLVANDLIGMPAGKYEIEGKRCYVSVEDGTTQDAEKRKIESHRQYIDLQYVAKGTERFGLIRPKDAEPINEYKPDVRHYTATKIRYVDSDPDIFFMFFPNDYHQAMVKAGKEGEKVRVIVVKMEYLP